ncbi:MAG: agmatine deiminase family protein [Planctomycetia bacterium]|nr:agmatine deiminase family protein [Planctomycetia bacterium]
MLNATPASLGYRWPAEWEPHAATWLAWPRKPETWPGKFAPIPAVWTRLVRTLAQFEPVHILAGGEGVMAQARSLVGGLSNVTLHDIATNDVWTRDHGAMFLSGRDSLPPALVDWEYNAWGGKYPPFDLDNAVPGHMARLTGRRCFTPGIILEGGAVDGNGSGTVLTTEPCLLNPNRNPQLSKPEVERFLVDFCCAKKILWLGGGIAGDDTDGHIDELARFVGPTTVVAALEEDPKDENYEPLQDNYRRLLAMSDAQGRPLEVVTIPMPRPLFHNDTRLPACYMNFYIANGVVIVPQFGDAADRVAIETLGRLFPTRQIRGLDAVDLVWGLGAFHCITQQQPA